MNKILFMTLAALSTSFAFSQTDAKDEQAVRAIVSTLETGWNNKSGETFSSVFADVHDYIVVNGFYFSNFTKKANAAAHQNLFDGIYKNRDIRLKIDKVNFLRSDLAMITALGAGYEAGQPVPDEPGAIMTILAEKKNGEWKIISFHNHDMNNANDQSPIPRNVMYATWYKK
jgi:uncharacterized protein (TIGR02246 family)